MTGKFPSNTSNLNLMRRIITLKRGSMLNTWKSACVSSSMESSSKFIPFSSMQARITCCNSASWISPSPASRPLQVTVARSWQEYYASLKVIGRLEEKLDY